MRLVDRLDLETGALLAAADAVLLREVDSASYKRYLIKAFGFIAPLERSISTTPDIESYVDLRRFCKEELLRRDLIALRVTSAQLHTMAQCSVPLFDDAETALGWAYCSERSTLGHMAVFSHFARAIPGEVAFAGSYLKCYFGAVGEMWRAFGDVLDRVQHPQRVLDAARAACRSYAAWLRPTESRPLEASNEEQHGLRTTVDHGQPQDDGSLQ